MARTKQTARQSTGGKAPAPPPPPSGPPPPPPLPGEDDELTESINLKSTKMTAKKISKGKGANAYELDPDNVGNMQSDTPNLSSILSPSVLLRQKEGLKAYGTEEVQLDREGLLEGSGHARRNLPLISTLDYMRTHSEQARVVTVLNFSGTDQLSDMFWFMVQHKKIHMPRLSRISLSGCYDLTNAGIRWMVKAFPQAEYVELSGIKNLTEESLLNIISKWAGSIVQLNVSGSSIGMIPPGYQGSIKLNGCPLVSPTETLYKSTGVKISDKMNRPTEDWSSFKVVIVTDDTVPWSPLALITGEKDIKARKKLRMKTNVNIGKSTQINLFEVPVDSGFVGMLVSKGSIVIIPYLLAEDGPDPDYPEDICKNIIRVFTQCPDCVFVVLGITSDTGPLVKEVAGRYFNLISDLVRRKMDQLNTELKFSIETKLLMGRMFYYCQQMFSHGQELLRCLKNMVKPDMDLSQPDRERPPAQILPSMMNIEEDNKSAFEKTIESAIDALKFHFPWYFIPYQLDLKNALVALEKERVPLTRTKDIVDSKNTSSGGFANFTSHPNNFLFIGKMLELLDRMGKYLYYPELAEGYALSEFTFMEDVYDKLLNGTAPCKASWRFLGANIPCWTKDSIAGLCPQPEMGPVVAELLQKNGLLLCMPRDVWTTELSAGEPYAYVLLKDLPYYPAVDIEDLWPDGVPSDEVQLERYYTFMPGVPDAYFPAVLRDCLELGGVRLLWNKGAIIRKGPVTVLVEMLNNSENTQMLFVGARMVSDGVNADPLSDAHLGVFKIYKGIIRASVMNFKIYALETIPCAKCHPPKNRYRTVNARGTEIWQMKEQLLMSYHATQRNITCRNDGSEIKIPELMNPASHADLVPSHYYLGCQPSFSAYNRCMFCQNCAFAGAYCEGNLQNGKTSWNCSCDREGQMCGVCGICQRCATALMEKEKLFQFFDEDGNGVLDNEEMGKLNAALFNMFPRFGYKGQEPPEDDTPSGFPMEIVECRNLEYLNMYYQGFVSVPPEIGNLQDLKMVNVSHNPNLLSIPAEIGTISSLTRLEMEECPLLKTPPKEIRVKGFSTTYAYLRRLMSGSLPCKRTKLMLVGLGGAGKTSLVNSLLSKDGKANLSHGEAITDGIDICTWTVKAGDEHITYSVWDFAGQTVYYNTHQFFLSNRAVYLLLWNVRLGFEHAGLDFWLSSISVQAPKAPIFVVGSHIDQVSKYELPINEMRERYKQIAGFHFVSSFTGQGIKDLQENLFDVTLQQQYMGEQIPEVWLTFENNVMESRSSCNVIEYSALEKMANISGIFEKSEIYQAIQFLHELGSLQHFTTESLKSKVIVNPQWIVDVMACVVSVKNSPIKEGRLKHSDIGTVWKDYPADLHDWLLKLTEEYDLTFPLEHEPVNLVPCLLPEKAPEFTWPEIEKDSDLKENKMIYKFDYLPAGLFNRGQVRLHQISDSALIWKRGSFLKKNGHIALLHQTRDSELIVQVQGPRPENVIFLVHEVFEGLIAESFRGVTYDFLIPCPDCLRMALKDPHMFKASTIRRAMELKAPFLQCIKYFHTISCIDLLACMPPDNHSDFDLHLVQSVRSLRDLRKDLAADIFMSYCGKDAPASRSSVIHPATVCEDLQAVGYKCWFAAPGKTYSIEEMARALTDASVVIAFISNDYAKDEDCVNIFKYARLTLRKPMIVVAVGDGFEWKQSKLGILLSDEVYVNMIKSKKEVYQSKFEELLKAVSSKTNKQIGVNPTPSCFFSYTWVNSATAVKLGTRSVPGALGYGDPRDIKQNLEKHGIKCWIDVERVGQNGLFDDIAEGLLSARLVIVCVSDEYANSSTCRMEFRYAANTLKLPIILAVVGTGNNWRASEVGVLSLRYPIVSFQEKSETAYSTLLSMVKEKLSVDDPETEKDRKNKQNNEHKNLSFQELFELAQRKLLRQLCFYAEHQDVDVYPRLFIVDFLKSKPEDDIQEETEDAEEENHSEPGSAENANSEEKPSKTKPVKKLLERQLSKKKSEMKSIFKMQTYCVHTLCEHDEGWHSVTEPIHLPHDFGETLLDKFCPLIARMTAVMKYNKHFNFNCMQSEFGEDYITWLEENPQATMSDYQEIYHEFRQLVIDADSHRNMGKLARCRLPNGKTIWLCDRHRKSMKVTVLSSDATANRTTESVVADNMYMVTGLRSGQNAEFSIKFTSSRTAKRRKENVQGAKKDAGAGTSDMYTTYELLPDRKVPKPSVMKKKMSKASVDETETKAEKGEEEHVEKEKDSSEKEAEEKPLMKKKTQMKKSAKTPAKTDFDIESSAPKSLENVSKGDQELPKQKDITQEGISNQGKITETSGQREATEEKKSKLQGEVTKESGDIQQPQTAARAKTYFGKPGKKEEFPKEEKFQQDRPTMSRSKTTVEKPKSKTCSLM
ncbi:uncharacterized protein LOC123566493 [Mercenaria mercenaria]|uniref:uncharacterized protein LOC123566493 n=1 Tax=Mercenaria mercenaria TaxID=6596 RepID=UPI00234EC82A|nr:uncharacterized protein LOC123566493 [Mercenaria mercenaria]